MIGGMNSETHNDLNTTTQENTMDKNTNMKNNSFIAAITANVDAFISDYNDPKDVALACMTVAKRLTIEQVQVAYADAVERGLIQETPKKRRYVAKAMARLVTMGNFSAWNLLPRKTLRKAATTLGIVVGNGRSKANFVRTMALVA